MKKFFLLLLLITTSINFGQKQLETIISGGIGYGAISSNSPAISSLALHGSLSQEVGFLPVRIKLNYSYLRDSEFFLPMSNSANLYFSYLQVINIGAELFQYAGDYICFSEFFSYSLVKDNVFEGINSWANGMMFSAEIGVLKSTSSLWFSAGFNYGLTFDKNMPAFSSFYIKANYSFGKI